MQPIPYVFFRDCRCAEAMTEYARILDLAPPDLVPFSLLPPGAAGGLDTATIPKHAVMHAALKVGDGWIYGSDDPAGETSAMAGVNIYIALPTVEKARPVFDALMEGGEIRMDLAPTSWAEAYGAGTDRWGTRWMISVNRPQA